MIDGLILRISDFLYTPWVPLFLVAAGLTFTICTGFVQFRMVREAFRVVREKPRTEGAVSSFGALMLSTASRVGTGNIVGVAQAICLGGVGAVFWMWFIALFGEPLPLWSPPWPKSTSVKIPMVPASVVPLIIWRPLWGSGGWAYCLPYSLF